MSCPLAIPRVWSLELARKCQPRRMIAARKGTGPGLQTHSGFIRLRLDSRRA